MSEIQIAQALLFDRNNRLLIYLRDNKPEIPFPNHWDFFGGHVEEGETPEQALVREIKEELGVALPTWEFFRAYECATGDAYPNIKYIYRARVDKTPDDLILYEGQRLASISPRGAFALQIRQYSRRDLGRFHRCRLVAQVLWITLSMKFVTK